MTSWQDEHIAAGMRDFAAGTLSGVAGVIAGHPLDTIRVRMQSSTTASIGTIKDVYKSMISSEGALSVFKGLASPMAAVGFLNAMLFYSYGQIQTAQRRYDPEDTLTKVFVAGVGAGIFQATALAPIENIKIRLQVQTHTITYRGPLDCAQQLYRNHGMRGIYKGYGATLNRDSWSYGIYFATYEAMKRHFQGESLAATPLQMFLAGGLAGIVSWLPIYPIDVIKTRIQEDDLANSKYKGILDCYRQSLQRDGWRIFFRGLSPTLLRTFIVSGANFLVYELAAKALSLPPT